MTDLNVYVTQEIKNEINFNNLCYKKLIIR